MTVIVFLECHGRLGGLLSHDGVADFLHGTKQAKWLVIAPHFGDVQTITNQFWTRKN